MFSEKTKQLKEAVEKRDVLEVKRLLKENNYDKMSLIVAMIRVNTHKELSEILSSAIADKYI